MADITYSRTFTHDDWIDNEDVVQAGGGKGFNKKFHDIEVEFDAISTAVGQLSEAINKIQRLRWVKALSAQTLAVGALSPEIEIEQYAQSEVAENTQKVYFTSMAFVPPNVLGQVQTFIYYKPSAGDTIRVTMQFKNVGTVQTTFIAQVFSIS